MEEKKRKYTRHKLTRKPVDGEQRNKERTRQKWIDAVGVVLRKQGYAGLSIKNIVAEAGMDRKLIKLYFGDVNQLIEEYLSSIDFWKKRMVPQLEAIINETEHFGQKQLTEVLHLLFEVVHSSDDLINLLNWEDAVNNKRLRELAETRDEQTQPLLESIDPVFQDSAINIRPILALLVSGIYYLNIHAKVNGSTICAIDINKEDDFLAIKKALEQLVELLYRAK